MNNKKIERNMEIITAFESTVNYMQLNNLYEQALDEIEFLAIYHILYTAVMRINEVDCSNKMQGYLVDYVRERYPQYKSNKYLQKLMTKKEKIVIRLIGAKQFRFLSLMFKVNRLISADQLMEKKMQNKKKLTEFMVNYEIRMAMKLKKAQKVLKF